MSQKFLVLMLLTTLFCGYCTGVPTPDWDHPEDEVPEFTDKQLKRAIDYRCIPNGARCKGGALYLTPPQRCCGICSFRTGKCKSYKPGSGDYWYPRPPFYY